jgi:ribosome-associated translation inhibitor RaiA
MPNKTIKIPKNIEIKGNMSDFVCAKINRIKMSDITTTAEFSVTVTDQDIVISNTNQKALDRFCKELRRLIKDGGNKLTKMLK